MVPIKGLAPADAGAGARRVRVEVTNAEGLPPGLNCWVRFAEPTEAWQSQQARANKDEVQQVAAGPASGPEAAMSEGVQR